MEALKSVQSFQTVQKNESIKRQDDNLKTYIKESIKEDTQKPQVSKQDLKDVIKALNNMPIFRDILSFGFSGEIGQLLVQIKDKKTGNIIRRYPSEDFIKRMLYYRDNIGFLFDKEA